MSGVILVTDGTAHAAALAGWLADQLGGAILREAHGPADLSSVIEASRTARQGERVAAIGSGAADISGAEALSAVREWLRGLSAIDVRSVGPQRIEELRARGTEGAEALDQLLLALNPVPPRLKRGRRGRPRGIDAFRGAGFDTAVMLLLHPERRWTERALADATGRAPSAVHRIFAELARRGYLTRARGETRVPEPEMLRDDLARAWRERVGVPRGGRWFIAPKGREPLREIERAARKHRAPFALAAGSALRGSSAMVGGPLTLYLAGDVEQVLAGALDFATRSGDVLVWEPQESGVFLETRELAGVPATNRVVTWLDLAVGGSGREQHAAAEVWEGTA